jgi:FkbM family methyltransferase
MFPDAIDLKQIIQTHAENAAELLAAHRAGGVMPPIRLRNGFVLHHSPEDPVADLFIEICLGQSYTGNGFYTPAPGHTVLDCGANIGIFALYMASQSPGVRVCCFEPCRETFERLRRNINANNLSARVEAYRYAVADREGEATLYVTDSSGDQSLFRRAETKGTEVAPCTTLEGAVRMCKAATIDLLKLDIEGSEIELMEGASGFSWDRVKRVALEYHDFFRPGCRNAVQRLLEGYGFEICGIHSRGSGDVQGVMRAARRNLHPA